MYMLIDMEYTPFSSLGYEMYYFDYINNTFHTRTMVMILIAKLIILCVVNKKQRILLVSFFIYHDRKYPKTNTSRFCKLKMMFNTSFSLIKIFSMWTCAINLTLITIVNPGLKNRGPANSIDSQNIDITISNSLKIHYQNIQGLIPFSCLSDPNPLLDVSKIFDLIILNETWLKDIINNNEILSCNEYKLFRCDRTLETHPPDPDDPKKFRKNGGGVLMAVRNNIAINTQRIDLKCKAEFLAIEIIMKDKSKIIVATCYRVGTLGLINPSEITNTVKDLVRKKKVKKFILLGDFNLPGVSWSPVTSSTNSIC